MVVDACAEQCWLAVGGGIADVAADHSGHFVAIRRCDDHVVAVIDVAGISAVAVSERVGNG